MNSAHKPQGGLTSEKELNTQACHLEALGFLELLLKRPAQWKEALFKKVKKLFIFIPYLSLLAGLWSAFIIKRSTTVAMVTVLIALVSWGLILILALFYARLDHQQKEKKRFKAAEFIVIWLLQNGMQQSLFFVFPLYFASATFRVSHILFLCILLSAAVIVLWDPLYEKLMAKFWSRLSLQIYVSFIGFNAILPMLGLANRWSLILAGIGSALGLPFFLLTFAPSRKKNVLHKQLTISSIILFIMLPMALYFGIASWIPAAPLRIVSGGMGTQYIDHQLVEVQKILTKTPKSLICASNISSPHGLKDQLFHIWSLNGKQTDRIALSIRGGRKQGFRTYSKKSRHIKKGRYRCQVETASGQVLGSYSVEVL